MDTKTSSKKEMSVENLKALAEKRQIDDSMYELAEEEARRLQQHSLFSRSNTKKIIAAAACIAVCIIGISISMNYFDTVSADKNRKTVVQEQGGARVVQPEIMGAEQAVHEKKFEITAWERLNEQKDYLPQLLIPNNIPEGCSFSRLLIDKDSDGSYDAEYRFLDSNEKPLIITQAEYSDAMGYTEIIEKNAEAIETQKGKFFKTVYDEQNTCFVQGIYGECKICIWGDEEYLTDDRIAEIIDDLN